MRLNPLSFDEWFYSLNDSEPFPWQKRFFLDWLCAKPPKKSRWPKNICIPTACGKTSIIDLSVLALAAGAKCARRRTVFVVDRRVVVDEAYEHAKQLEEKLSRALRSRKPNPLKAVAKSLADLSGEGKPLVVAELRGGIAHDDAWARSPLQPAVILSTVDQVGSRLLFRSYGGASSRAWPIHAGLLGRDTIIVVDEAHCSNPFCETLESIEKYWQNFAECVVGEPISTVRMSATLLEKADFTLNKHDYKNKDIKRRLTSPKIARLIPIESEKGNDRQDMVKEMLALTNKLLDEMEDGVIGVVVNRVADARWVFEKLDLPENRKLLLTGRVRGWERDRLLEKWLPKIRAGAAERPTSPVVVVATQCIEVGANLDFDALVTEIAPLDSLRQRFGRLNRLGNKPFSTAAILATSQQTQIKQDVVINPDPIYGESLCRTWLWLTKISENNGGCVDMSSSYLDKVLPREKRELERIFQKPKNAHILFPSHLDLLVQTSPTPLQDPEISAFLHGETTVSPDVTLLWRCDLEEHKEDSWRPRVAMQPPATGEGCQVPVWEFWKWMSGDEIEKDTGDIEGAIGDEANADSERLVLRWRGPEEAEVIAARHVRPGDVVVVPSTYGGCDKYGWNPRHRDLVEDIGDMVAAGYRKPALRVTAAISILGGESQFSGAVEALKYIEGLAKGELDTPSIKECLDRIAQDVLAPGWLRRTAKMLSKGKHPRIVEANGFYALLGWRGKGEDASTSCMETDTGVEVGLFEHNNGVAKFAKTFSAILPKEVGEDVVLAAKLHDLGKADPRFQALLYGGSELLAVVTDKLLAKSVITARDITSSERAHQNSGFPRGGRHEGYSYALVDSSEFLQRRAHDPDLVMHLIVSHHGYARPFFPYVRDTDPPNIKIKFDGSILTSEGDHGLYRIDSGIAERFWRMVRRYGWWGLAYLEGILRLADHRESEREQGKAWRK